MLHHPASSMSPSNTLKIRCETIICKRVGNTRMLVITDFFPKVYFSKNQSGQCIYASVYLLYLSPIISF